MKIAVYGLGYVGLTAAACLAESGHEVIGVEVSESKVADMNAGVCPIAEPGLEEMLQRAIANKRFHAVQFAGDLLDTCDMAIVCVGTPSAPDGSHNMGYIAEVSRQIAASLSPDVTRSLTVVFRSTFRPGTMAGLVAPLFASALGETYGARVELVYNPEFLREATAIADYFAPPKIVVGTANGEPSARMQELYAGIDAPMFHTPFNEAEFTKFVDNSWHAVKVAFANEIGRICMKLDVQSQVIHKIFVADTKLNISPYYTRPGGAFGGSCLPKDVRALQYIAGDVGANASLMDSLLRSNEAHKHFIYEYVAEGLAPGARVLMTGLAFKKDSDDLRESPHVDLARKLLQGGFKLSIYDPSLSSAKLVGQNLGYAYSHLPNYSELLISHDEAETGTWDLVVDPFGARSDLKVEGARRVSVNALP